MMPRRSSFHHRRALPRTAVRLAGAAALFAVAGVPMRSVEAQTSIVSPFRFEAFGARNESATTAMFGGLSLAGYSGIFGLRLGGSVAGLDLGGDNTEASTPVRSCSRSGCRNGVVRQYSSGSGFSSDAWTADADLIAEPFRSVPVLRQLLLGFSPYAFAGIGRYSVSVAPGVVNDTTRSVWSYGAGVHHDLLSRIGVTAEARVRRTLDDNAFVGRTFRNAVQYRVGFSIGAGGRARRSRSNSSSVPEVVIVSRGPIPGSTPVSSSVPLPVPAAATPDASDDRTAAELMPRVLDAADAVLNSPWRDGGTSPGDGFDAGGFVQYVFAQEQIALPRLVRDLAQTGMGVTARVGSLRAGDLLLFSSDGTTPDHVAIYVGRDRIVHATSSGGGVRYDVLGEGARGVWFAEHLSSVRRVLGARSVVPRPATPSLTPSGRPDSAPRPAAAP
jgi:cell wall-associated NlpC family hydrolase